MDSNKFRIVHNPWKKVLALIMMGKGGNSLVEHCRGLKQKLSDVTLLLYGVDKDIGDYDELEADGDSLMGEEESADDGELEEEIGGEECSLGDMESGIEENGGED